MTRRIRWIRGRRRAPSRIGAVVVALAAMLALVLPVGAGAAISPPTATLNVSAGGSATENKTVDVPAVPARADIQIAFDTTGSMGPTLDQAKADAAGIVNDVKAVAPDAQFSIVEFKDFGDSPEYRVATPFTGDQAAIQAGINSLSASGGGDFPEAYNLTFHNSYAFDLAPDPGWRAGSRKFLIVMGDAPPHGAASAGFTACGDTSADPHGLNTATELAGMNTAQRTLFMIRQSGASTPLACYDALAAAAFTGSDAVDQGTDLSAQIVALIKGATSTVTDLHLEVTSATPAPAAASWISFSPTSVGPITSPSSQSFTVTVNVPAGTPDGTYTFDIVALADGADIGHQTLTVVVSSVTPPTGAECDVKAEGKIKKAANGDKAAFDVDVESGTTPKGKVRYTDHGPAAKFKLRSSEITDVTIGSDQREVTVEGTGTVNGTTVDFRVDLRDLSGGPDTFRIRLSNGYDSGEQTLRKGELKIKCENEDDDGNGKGEDGNGNGKDGSRA
jgi:hypothetical protein